MLQRFCFRHFLTDSARHYSLYKFKLRRGRRVRRQERNGSSEHRSVRGCRHAVLRKFRLRLCSCVWGVRVVVRVARESSRKLEPLSQFKATSSREMAVKA